MKLDKHGLKQLQDEIARVSEKLSDAKKRKGESFANDTNSWHDNFEYDQANRDVIMITRSLADLNVTLREVEIIEKHHIADAVDIGDIVTIFDIKNNDEFKLKLNADYEQPLSLDDEIETASVNSPIGSAIYKKQKGDKVSYLVGDRTFDIVIKSIEKEKIIDNSGKNF